VERRLVSQDEKVRAISALLEKSFVVQKLLIACQWSSSLPGKRGSNITEPWKSSAPDAVIIT